MHILVYIQVFLVYYIKVLLSSELDGRRKTMEDFVKKMIAEAKAKNDARIAREQEALEAYRNRTRIFKRFKVGDAIIIMAVN